MNNPISLLKIKVVIVGDAGVGKTSLAFRFTENSYLDHYKQTVGASFCSRAIDVNDKRVVFQIWDTAGQERFRSLVPMYLRDAEVALLVYDISNYKSFESLDHWFQQLQRYGPPRMKCALVGNKADLEEVRAVKREAGHAFADEHSLYFEETSAKTGHEVDKVFTDIGRALTAENRKTGRLTSSTVSIATSYVHQRNKASCCKR